MPTVEIDPTCMIQSRRKLTGISAILLPFNAAGEVDWPGLEMHIRRTAATGLVPAVNMDTGFVNLIDDATRLQVLQITQRLMEGRWFCAGAYSPDQPGATWCADEYLRQMEMIQQHGGTPVIFQSYGLTGQDPSGIIAAYEQLAAASDRFIAFELTADLLPFGATYELETYQALMQIPQCVGAKHSSFRREPEWQRLLLRDEVRPDFKVFTGNDLAIDMVMYGSDYLLGLSTFGPDYFARRDAYWEAGDPRFYELNDTLQYLGAFAFRNPGPGYKHSAAQFLKLRGWIDCDATCPGSPTRPESDVPVLADIITWLDAFDGRLNHHQIKKTESRDTEQIQNTKLK